jgi:hypothetical protein
MRVLAMFICAMLASGLASGMPVSAAEEPSPWTDNFGEARSPTIPKKVRKFVIAAQACGHFSGEEPYDEERRKFLERMIRENCTGIEERREKLLTKYRGNAEVEAIIGEVWEPFA